MYYEISRSASALFHKNGYGKNSTPEELATFEEFFEILTLKQLGRHNKPIAIYNINGFYDNIEKVMYDAMNEKFIRSNCRTLYMIFSDIDELFAYVERCTPHNLTVHDLKDG